MSGLSDKKIVDAYKRVAGYQGALRATSVVDMTDHRTARAVRMMENGFGVQLCPVRARRIVNVWGLIQAFKKAGRG